jgi:hypothetical protein
MRSDDDGKMQVEDVTIPGFSASMETPKNQAINSIKLENSNWETS